MTEQTPQQQATDAMAQLRKAEAAKAQLEAYRAEGAKGWSWSGAGSAAAGGAATGAAIGSAFPVYGTAIGAVVGAVLGAILYGIGVGEAPHEAPPLKPFEDPKNTRLLWHHEGRAFGFVNGRPLELVAKVDQAILPFPLSEQMAGLVLTARGAFRPQHPIIDRGFCLAGRPLGNEVDRYMPCVRGWADPSDCRVNAYIPTDQEGWTALAESWLDAFQYPEEARPDYDVIVVGEIETPWSPFMVPNGPHAAIWAHGDTPAIPLSSGVPVGKPDVVILSGVQLPLYPLVIWIWRATRCGIDTGCTRPAPAGDPPLAGAVLVALQVPDGRPVKAISSWTDEGGGGGGALFGKAGLAWLLAPAAGLALGILGKLFR